MFVTVLTVIYGSYWTLVVRGEEHADLALRRRLFARRPTVLGPAFVKTRERLSHLPFLDRLLTKSHRVTDPLRRLLDQAGSTLTPGAVLLAVVFIGITTALAVFFVSRSVLVAAGLGALAAHAPISFFRWRGRKRLALFEEQFPEAIDLMARCLRAGHALPTALQLAGEEIPDPVGAEFRHLFERQNYGMSLPETLREFGNRIPVLDARFFATAVLTQREMGGNLSEVLDNLASVIRERFKVKRQVKVLSAHGRITAAVLGFLPPAVATVLFITSPSHLRLLIDDPLGLYMVGAAITLQAVGVLIIKRIVNVEY
jgi:tight adherence protein B